LLAAALLIAIPLHAGTEADRLSILCRVWATVDYLNPDVVFGDVDWDAALIRAIPKVRAATTDADLASAIGEMLRQLNDPATHIVAVSNAPVASEVPLAGRDGDVLIVNAGPYAAAHEGIWTELPALADEVSKAQALVVDLRFQGEPERAGEMILGLSLLDLARGEATTPSKDFVMHSGFPPEDGATSGGYYTALLTFPGSTIRAARARAPSRVVFVTDARSPVPDQVAGLRNGGHAVVVSADPLDASALADTKAVSIAGPWRAVIRVSRARGSFAADLVTAEPMAEALAFARGEKTLSAGPEVTEVPFESGIPRQKPKADYTAMVYPDTEHRILAAFRIWSVIESYYPYRSLIGDWHAVLGELLPHFIAAQTADEYAAAVLEMVARVEDGHSSAFGHPSVPKLLGSASPAIRVRVVEDQFVVTRVFDESSAVRLGDVVVSVDGEPFRSRVNRLRKYVTASTERARINRIAATALRGKPGSEAVLELQEAGGMVRTVRLTRNKTPPERPVTEAYRVVDDNVGYVDLTALTPPQVDDMFDKLMSTKAIIFDMRGYPRGTAWQIAPRINRLNAKIGAVFRRPQVSGAFSMEGAASGFYFEQPLPNSDKPIFNRQTIMLIDDRALSQAEHTALFFEAASGTTYIGSHTAGANGDVTSFRVPGGFRVAFTGHDVRHADGRQLQRVGIVPHIEVEPTIQGIREARDEVLQRAIEYANQLER
jgi:C-terminal processing protease CtpA/Prc